MVQDCINSIKCVKKYDITRLSGRNRPRYAISSRTLFRLFAKTKLQDEVFDLHTAEVLLKDTYQQYYQIKNDHIAHRRNCIEGLAFAKGEEENKDPATILKQILLREQQRSLSRKL